MTQLIKVAPRVERKSNAVNSARARWGLLAFVIVLGVLFFMKTNSAATLGYHVKELDDRTRALQKESQKLDLEVAELSSMKAVALRLQTLGYVPADDLEFVEPVDASVAVR